MLITLPNDYEIYLVKQSKFYYKQDDGEIINLPF